MAEERAQDADLTGFYGGLSMRDRGSESTASSSGICRPRGASSHCRRPRTAAPARWRSAAIAGPTTSRSRPRSASAERFSLRPDDPLHGAGVGFALANGADARAKTWNVDVYTSWGFAKSFSLYGRLGLRPERPGVAVSPRLLVAAMSAAIAMASIMASAFATTSTGRWACALEYARYGRLAGEMANGVLPDSDQVQFGLQFRF